MKSTEVLGYVLPNGDTVCKNCATEDNISEGNPIFAGDEDVESFVCDYCSENLVFV